MNILYLTFYFEPDLCPGSFRNTALVNELACQLSADDHIHVVTTQPNRYKSFRPAAPVHEQRGNRTIDRVVVPTHNSGFLGQIWTFWAYYRAAYRLTRSQSYDLVVASSSRLFTAFLGARLAQQHCAPLFLDIRDLFRETILEMLSKPVAYLLRPVLWLIEQYTFRQARHINLVSAGFQSYFQPFHQASYSYFTNGIDDEFLTLPSTAVPVDQSPKTILYAGNIGAGQALDTIIPQAARLLGEDYQFVVIGAGGTVAKLEVAVRDAGVQNVQLRPPIGRHSLLAEYQRADYLLVHLADLEALKRVLPSKLFEYGAMDKPILAGVSGYAASFVTQHLANSILFKPGDAAGLAALVRQTPYRTQHRPDFVETFDRKAIVADMAWCIRTIAVGEHSLQTQTVAI